MSATDAEVAVPPTGSRLRATLVATLLPVGLLAGMFWLVDSPRVFTATRGREVRAALAIRDAVDPMETLLTWAFVRPRLDAAYAEVRTLTERDDDGGASRGDFVSHLGSLAARFPAVDVYCLAHTNDYVSWLKELPRETTARIRFVYNSGCRCGAQGDAWLALGAEAFVGHPDAASHAPFLVHFLRRWLAGETLRDAVSGANERAFTFYRRMAPLGAAWVLERDPYDRSPGEIRGTAALTLEDVP